MQKAKSETRMSLSELSFFLELSAIRANISGYFERSFKSFDFGIASIFVTRLFSIII